MRIERLIQTELSHDLFDFESSFRTGKKDQAPEFTLYKRLPKPPDPLAALLSEFFFFFLAPPTQNHNI